MTLRLNGFVRQQTGRLSPTTVHSGTTILATKPTNHPPSATAMPPFDSPHNSDVFLILIAVAGILLLQIMIVIGCLFYRTYKAKAKWRRLSQEGVVLIDGPAVFWTDDLPLPSVPVRFSMVDVLRSDRETSRANLPGMRRSSQVQRQIIEREG